MGDSPSSSAGAGRCAAAAEWKPKHRLERHSLFPNSVPVVEIDDDVCRMGLHLLVPGPPFPPPTARRSVGVQVEEDFRMEEDQEKPGPRAHDDDFRMEEVKPLRTPAVKKEDDGPDVRFPGREWLEPEHWTKEAPPTPAESALLDIILRHHYNALALLCKDKDADDVLRGMVLAGYAYGLERSPVHNIITNARWYKNMFPAKVQVKVRMLGCRVMLRLACRSFDALVAFMATYAPALTQEDILAYLTITGGHLLAAVALLDENGITHATAKDDAFRAAIRAARLPHEAATQAHLRLFIPSRESAQALYHKHQSAAVLNLQLPADAPVPTLSRGACKALRTHIKLFRLEEELCLDMVHKALEKLGEHYELHMICGNNLISRSEGFYHVNFLASPDGNNVPTLFFAEVIAVHREIQEVTLCCPVTGQGLKESGGASFAGACASCEGSGRKLIHPADRTFYGQLHSSKSEICRQEPTYFMRLPLMEDYLFFEADRQPDVANFLEAIFSGVSDARVTASFISIL